MERTGRRAWSVAVGAAAGGRRWPAAHGTRARRRSGSGDAGRVAAGAAEPRRWAGRPVAPLLAALALLGEALIGYVLAMLALRSLCVVTRLSRYYYKPSSVRKKGASTRYYPPRSGRIRTRAAKRRAAPLDWPCSFSLAWRT